jgi:hypothetical protein
MIIRTPRPEQRFTIIDNRTIEDQRLSYKARGILTYILSRPDNWATSAVGLARLAPEGRDAILAGLTELETAGYLKRVRTQDHAGRWKTVTHVYDRPWRTCAEDDSPNPDYPNSENPDPLQELTNKDYEIPREIINDPDWEVCGLCRGVRYDPEHLLPCHNCNAQGLIHAG